MALVANSVSWDSRGNKEVARKLAVKKTFANEQYARVALHLPGRSSLCVKEALKAKRVNKDKTKLICVEGNPTTAAQSREVLERIGWNPSNNSYHNGKFEQKTNWLKYHLDKHHSQFVDFGFLDFCGYMTYKVANWLMDYAGAYFNPNGTFSFTFTVNPIRQGYDFMSSAREQFAQVKHLLNVSRNNTVHSKICTQGWDATNDTINLLLWALSDFNITVLEEKTYRDNRCTMLLVKIQLNGYNNHKNAAIAKSVLENIITSLQTVRDSAITSRNNDGWWNFHYLMPQKNTFTDVVFDLPNNSERAAWVRKAENGICPPWMTPQKWAWCNLNPNGIR